MWRGRRALVGDRRRRGPAQRRDHPGHEDRQRVAAGVDDARLGEHRQQLRPAVDRLLTGHERALEHVGDQRVLGRRVGAGLEARLRHVRELRRGRRGHVAHHGQHRPLGRLADRLVGALGGAGQRGRQQRRIDELAGARDQLLGGAADQLAEDHARVAARAEQRRARDRLDDLVAADLVERRLARCLRQAVELIEHRPQRERHVVAGVAVGDREHVEVVDLLAPRLQVVVRPLDDGAKADEARIPHGTERRPSEGLGDLAGLQAAGADVHPSRRAVDQRADLLEVRLEAAPGGAHGVAAVVSVRRALAAGVNRSWPSRGEV